MRADVIVTEDTTVILTITEGALISLRLGLTDMSVTQIDEIVVLKNLNVTAAQTDTRADPRSGMDVDKMM